MKPRWSIRQKVSICLLSCVDFDPVIIILHHCSLLNRSSEYFTTSLDTSRGSFIITTPSNLGIQTHEKFFRNLKTASSLKFLYPILLECTCRNEKNLQTHASLSSQPGSTLGNWISNSRIKAVLVSCEFFDNGLCLELVFGSKL